MSWITTDRNLLDAIDVEHPGLEAVRAAVEVDHLDAVRDQLIQYFRTRKFDADLDPPGPEDYPEATERGEELCRLLASRPATDS